MAVACVLRPKRLGAPNQPIVRSVQGQLPGCGMGSLAAVGMALARVVGVVAPLAERGQIVDGVGGGVGIDASGGEDDFATGLGMGPAVRSSATSMAPSALIHDHQLKRILAKRCLNGTISMPDMWRPSYG